MRLLILSCSARKQQTTTLLSAIDLYDGPAFRIVRNAHAAGAIKQAEIRILSARYGLIGAGARLATYDQRMTPARALELQSEVTQTLFAMIQNLRIDNVFVNVGRDYAPALAEFAPWCRRHDITCTEAAGGIGQRLAQLRTWLYA